MPVACPSFCISSKTGLEQGAKEFLKKRLRDGALKGGKAAGGSPVTRIQKEGYAGGMSLFFYRSEGGL